MLVCTKCFEIYNKNYIKKPFKQKDYWCPKLNCIGQINEIDELIYETIKILNKKGYKTEYCCSGHLYDEPIGTYITFDKKVMIPSLPTGFRFEYNSNTIRKILDNYKNKNISEKFTYIKETHEELLNWAEKLSNYSLT